MSALTVGSLFSGIGGLDLGLERAGMKVIWNSEIDPYACRVLTKHWPTVPNLGDVTSIDWTTVERPDVICGGYPCQPFSLAGGRLGADDHRHLWPHVATALRVLRPEWAVLENVAGHLSLGFGRVLGDLAEIGYDAEWDCIPASALGALHQRDRVILVAYPQRDVLRLEPVGIGGGEGAPVSGLDGPARAVAHADGERLEERRLAIPDEAQQPRPQLHGEAVSDADSIRRPRLEWSKERELDPTWAVEPDVDRVAHGVPSRVDRLRCLGNAVVPQVAEHIGRLIVEAHRRAA